jgi:hypothetical protein
MAGSASQLFICPAQSFFICTGNAADDCPQEQTASIHRANVVDPVIAGLGSMATVVYDDGCKVDVQPGAVTTIAALSPCAAGAYAQLNDWDPRLVVPGAIGGMIMDIVLGTSGRARPASP